MGNKLSIAVITLAMIFPFVACSTTEDCSHNKLSEAEQAIFMVGQTNISFKNQNDEVVEISPEISVLMADNTVKKEFGSDNPGGVCTSNASLYLSSSDSMPNFKLSIQGSKNDGVFKLAHFDLSNSVFLKSDVGFNLTQLNATTDVEINQIGSTTIAGREISDTIEILYSGTSGANIIKSYLYSPTHGLLKFEYAAENSNAWTRQW